jgi:hypothetical protein
MKQIELARRTGYSRFGINLILKGKRGASRTGAIRLAEAVPGSKIIDWIFSEQNRDKLVKLVDKAA